MPDLSSLISAILSKAPPSFGPEPDFALLYTTHEPDGDHRDTRVWRAELDRGGDLAGVVEVGGRLTGRGPTALVALQNLLNALNRREDPPT